MVFSPFFGRKSGEFLMIEEPVGQNRQMFPIWQKFSFHLAL